MDQLRRFIVPALLAGLALCGSLGWSSVASADETVAGGAKPAALAKATTAAQPAVASTPAPRAAAPAARASMPQRSTAASRSTMTRSTAATRTTSSAGGASRSYSGHLGQRASVPNYGIDGTVSARH